MVLTSVDCYESDNAALRERNLSLEPGTWQGSELSITAPGGQPIIHTLAGVSAIQLGFHPVNTSH